jgi:hypothetical protein
MSPVEGEHRMADEPLVEQVTAGTSRSGRADVGAAGKGNAQANESGWGIDSDHDCEIPIVLRQYRAVYFLGKRENDICRGMKELEWHFCNLDFCNSIFPSHEFYSGINPINP